MEGDAPARSNIRSLCATGSPTRGAARGSDSRHTARRFSSGTESRPFLDLRRAAGATGAGRQLEDQMRAAATAKAVAIAERGSAALFTDVLTLFYASYRRSQ